MAQTINAGKIQYGIGFQIDKTGLNELKAQLNELSNFGSKLNPTQFVNMNPGVFKNINSEARKALFDIQKTIKEVDVAFSNAFNVDTGLMNLQKLNTSLTTIGVDKIYKDFSLLGQRGKDAFYQITKSALTTEMQFKKTHGILDKMGQTLINTLKWQISSSAINRFTGAVQQAYGYVQHLDTSLNDIRIVTGKSADEMERFARTANKAAKSLGASTTEYTEAALIYYQQGLSDEEANARAATTLKAANVTGQSGAAVSEELTAVWNGYKVSAEETELAVDKLAAVAATTAADLEELSVGMSKVASAANNMGVDMDQLNAMIATIVSITRQAPESVGTALKTIFARMSDLKLGDTDEDGLKLGDVSGSLEKVGISILDTNGDLREMGDVIEEVAGKWNTWTKAQQAAVAQSLAGKRQYNNLVALFDNWDMYSKALNTSQNAMGTLQKQQDIYMESTEAHLQVLQTQWEDLYDSLLDEKTINKLTDSLTKVIKLVTRFIDSIGGGNNLFLLLGATATRVFSKQISQGITNFITNMQTAKENAAQLEAQLANIKLFKNSQAYKDNEVVRAMVSAQEEISKYYDILDNEQINAANALVKQVGEAKELEEQWSASVNALNSYAQSLNKIKGIDLSKFNFKGAGNQQITVLNDYLTNTLAIFKSIRTTITSVTKVGNDNVNASKETIKKYNKEVGDLKTRIEDLNKAGFLKGTPQQIKSVKKEIQNVINFLSNGTKKTNEQVRERIDGLKQSLRGLVPEKTKEEIEDLLNTLGQSQNIDFSAPQKSLEKLLETASTQNYVNNWLGLAGSIGQVASSINSLKNLGNIWTDENLSGSEKMLQTMTSMGFALPMLVSAYGKYKEALFGVIQHIRTKNGLTEIELILQKQLKAGKIEDAELEKAFDSLSKKKQANILKETGLQRNQIFTLDELKREEIAEMAIREKSQKLMMGITAGIAGLSILITGITSIISAHNRKKEEEKQAYIENKKAIIEEKEALVQERKAILETKTAMDELINSYKQGTISKEDFLLQSIKTIEGLDQEAQAAIAAAKSWQEASQAVDDYYARTHEQNAEDYQVEYNAGIATGAKKIKGISYNEELNQLKLSLQEGIFYNDEIEPLKNELINIFGEGSVTTKNGDKMKISLDPDSINQYLEKLRNIDLKFLGVNSAGVSDEYLDKIIKLLEKFQSNEDVKTAQEKKDLQYDEYSQAAGLKAGFKYSTSKDDFVERKGEFDKYLSNLGYSAEEIHKSYIDYISGISGNQYVDKAILEESVVGNITKSWFGDNFKGDIYSTEFYKNVVDFINQMIEKGFSTDDLATISWKDWTEYFANNTTNSLVGAEDFIIDQLEKNFDSRKKTFIETAVPALKIDLQKALKEGLSGSLDFDSEDFQNLASQIEKLSEFDNYGLKDEIEIFLDEGLIGTEKWTQAVYSLQEALNDLEMEKMLDDFSEKVKNIDVNADLSTLNDQLQELVDQDYSITVKVHSDAEEAFNNTSNALASIDEMANKIGEDFIVAAGDIRELNNTFPGILEGMEYLADGTVKLNEEAVKSAMEAASQEEKADTEATITKLQNTATELRAKAEIYDEMAQLAYEAAEDSTKAEQNKAEISKKLLEVEAKNDKIATDTEIENSHLVIDDAKENAPILAENWDQAYQEAASAANNWAEVATSAHEAALTGDKSKIKKDFGVTYQGQYSGSSEVRKAHVAEFGDQGEDKEYFKELGRTYENQAEAIRKQANDIEGMAFELGAKAIKSISGNARVGLKDEESSSSSGSEKEAKQEEYLKREHDIYRKINTELDQIGNKLDRIDEIESHSWGVSYLDALQEENKLLDEQLEKLEEKKALQIGDLGQRKKQLENEGFTFNENGSLITNAEDRLDALYTSYNTNYVDKYNSMSADAQEEFEAEMKAEEDRIKQIEDAVGDYEKLYGDYEDLIKELQDLYYKQIEKDVEEFNFEIDLELELSDARKEWKDFWHDVVKDVESDDFVGQIAKSFSKLGELIGVGGSSNNDVLGLTQHLKETLDEVNTQITTHGLDGLFGTDTKLSEENLTDYRDKLMSALKDAKEEIENISDNYLSMLESAQDMIDKQVEGWENIGDQINHNLELIKLISGENTYNALAKQYEQQYENNLQTIEAQRIGRDYWKEKIAEYKTLLAAAEEGTEEYKTLQKALDTSTEKYIEANKELNSTVEESIKNLQEWRKNSVNAVTETLDKAISGGLGTDMLEQEWKLINDYADQYFDNVERAVNMEEYTNILQDAAKATGLTAKNQEKINKFMDEELKKLNEKEKLTQYDIDESKARLEILKAEMALQDAQRNKSNMRLRRDNQGNYTYQYTGNEQAIEDAEKAGLTARKAWYELVKKRNKETNDYIIQLEKDRISLMNQLDEAELAGDEERANKLKELLNRNEEQIVFAYGEAQKTKQDLFSGTAQYFADVENAEILPMWDATVTQLVDRFAGDNKDSFITACKNAINELDIVQERYVEKTQRILNIAGVKYQELVEEGIDPTKEAIEELNGTNEELAEGLDDTNEKLDEMRSYLEECAQAYRDFKDDAVSAIQEANQALETLARTHMDVVNQINSASIDSALSASGIQGNLGYNDYSGGGNTTQGTNYNPTKDTKTTLGGGPRTPTQPPTIDLKTTVRIEAGSGRVLTDPVSSQAYLNNALANNSEASELLKKGYLARNSSGDWFIKGQKGADFIKRFLALNLTRYKFLNNGQTGFYIGSGSVDFGSVQRQTTTAKIGSNALTEVTNSLNTTSSSVEEDFWDRLRKKKGYKSGGYTGDWSGKGIDGIGGRAAILHQKELVLNESDTSNMLAAVEALRQMNIDKLAQSILATSIATAQMQIQTQLLSAQLSGLRDQYESSRNTTINADFSGVRTADEILRAFEELENYGLQQYNTGDASYRSY